MAANKKPLKLRTAAPAAIRSTAWLCCPFCGSAELHADYEPSQNAHSILCGYCHARGPVSGTRDEAVEAWNGRTLGQHDQALPEPADSERGRSVRRLEAENARLRAGLNAVSELINDSYGVTGLHLNGDVAPWAELRTRGRLEEWLLAFDDALSPNAPA